MADHIEFTKEMKKSYTILAPYMLETQFDMLGDIMKNQSDPTIAPYAKESGGNAQAYHKSTYPGGGRLKI